MSNGAGSDDDRTDDLARPLPEPVRQRVVGLASDTLGGLAAEEVPAPLRPFARFAPARRARLAAIPIAAAVDADADFRARVADRVRALVPELAAALDEGRRPAAVDPLDVAATAYLLRPSGWTSVVGEVLDLLDRESAVLAGGREAESVTRLRDQVTEARASARQERERRRAELAALKEENTTLRRTLRQARDRAKAAEEEAERQAGLAALARDQAAADSARADAELRRLRARIADAEAAIEASRRSSREDRDVASVRLRLLLDTLVDAAQGLRRELALPPALSRPADTVLAREPAAGGSISGPEDVVSLETLVALPQVHLVVDGYNVTKTAWPVLPLETQRTRLVTMLGGLAARTGAEITCVFDGAKLPAPPPVSAPRGVRVRFSPAGVSADDVIRQLVAAEPVGRPVVVVSSDREIADGIRRSGARPVPAEALVRLLAR
ncbi:NYN domain-containing protein [Actinopolymorpha pittospori]|uniref:RNA-binding protein with PIN domain n=1 Tax=Actinopolymorpha pittospori TaxID=648752 RepID=A0A927RPA0_9ACTN|nr:putative RNA-binding protein with PIN domain [Actinopolymorpha pittospori]